MEYSPLKLQWRSSNSLFVDEIQVGESNMFCFARGQILQILENLFELIENIGANIFRQVIDGCSGHICQRQVEKSFLRDKWWVKEGQSSKVRLAHGQDQPILIVLRVLIKYSEWDKNHTTIKIFEWDE